MLRAVRRFLMLSVVLLLSVALAGLSLLTSVVSSPAAFAQTADSLRRANQGAVSIITGGVNGTYIRIGSDLAAVLDNRDQLRVLPIIGKGSLQNISDLLYLRGIDVGIVQSDILAYIKREKIFPNIEQRIRYITKLYNEEIHVLGGKDVSRLDDLAGKSVNVDVVGSGTSYTASTLFGALGIKVEETHFDQALALEKLRNGEIQGIVYVAGKPTELFRKLDKSANVKFLPVPLTPDLLQIYLPSSLTHADYPGLLAEGESIDTVAVGAVMAVYNWEPNSDRYKPVSAFVQAFFQKFGEFLKPPRHPKWQEVNIAANVPGWTRFKPADEWLDRQLGPVGSSVVDRELKASFDEFVAFIYEAGGRDQSAMTQQSREALFARFLEWRRRYQEASPATAAGSPAPQVPSPAGSPARQQPAR